MEGFLLNEISSELIDAYQATLYCVTSSDPAFVLRIGEHSAELAALYRRADCFSATFITAWNPHGKQLTTEENETRQRQLVSLLASQGVRFYSGEGVSADGTWREPSLLIAGMDQFRSEALALQSEQNAFVFCGADAVPRLMLCSR